MKRIALYHLETLAWIDRLGTFAAAAERLNTTQPAISARVRELELQLGVSLFRREGRRMVLTTRGRRLVQACEPLRMDLERALMEASDLTGTTGNVRIGSGEIAAASCLPGFVETLGQELPGVTLEIEVDLTARMMQQLLAGLSDLVLLAGPITSPAVRSVPIGSVELAWCASPELAGCPDWQDNLSVWSLPAHSPLHDVTSETLAGLNIVPRAHHTCNNVRTLLQVVATGTGVAILPETMARQALAVETLVEILPRPDRRIHFEAAIRARETDPLVLQLFERTRALSIAQA